MVQVLGASPAGRGIKTPKSKDPEPKLDPENMRIPKPDTTGATKNHATETSSILVKECCTMARARKWQSMHRANETHDTHNSSKPRSRHPRTFKKGHRRRELVTGMAKRQLWPCRRHPNFKIPAETSQDTGTRQVGPLNSRQSARQDFRRNIGTANQSPTQRPHR